MPEIECGFENNSNILKSLGPTINLQIGFDSNFKPENKVRPALPEIEYHGLIDTGASNSCIDSDLADALQLPVIDQQTMAGAQGQFKANIYLAQLYFPGLGFYAYGRVGGVHLLAGDQSHLALLGRDFLQHMKMVYDGSTGSVILSRHGNN